ncbi:DUF6636 domain-containing protein [Nocardia asteroides]|nr:DUF6636 domain-containing protein [Nocardia asteroides]UGT48432.1 hypothetical protein LT345_28890 [Nocardia asteroides]SFL59487.1 hypothetical protein SAMN05444423_101215 [Nocardia asteroides]VEG32277.1 Uncharacterised protein [Nocardia asteroides]
MRSAIVMAALVVLAGGLAACGDGDSAQTTVSGPSASETSVPRPTGTQPGEPPVILPNGTTPTVPPKASGSGDSVPVPSALPSRDDATVDARDYQQRDNYYFQSPTGNIMCGILADAPFGVGCQLAHANVIPPQLPNCSDAPNRKVAVHTVGGKSEFLCTSQGIFVGSPVDGTNKGGGATLNYGDTLVVRGVACTSTEQGIRCDAAGRGFTISADSQTIF